MAINLICFFLALVWTLVASALAVLLFMLKDQWGHWIHRAFGNVWCRLMGIRVTVHGLENVPRSQALVFAPNHESMFDIIVLASLPITFKWVSKMEVARIPILGWGMKKMGCYIVRRDRSEHDLNVMKEVEDGLRSGISVLIFPEGTRTRTGELLPFKKGAFKTAQNARVPLMPVAIRGTRAIAPPGKIPSQRGHKVTVTFGKPMLVPPDADIARVTEKFRTELMNML